MTMFWMSKGRFAAVALAFAVGVAIFVWIGGPYELGLVDHRLLTLQEQQLVVGGQNQENSQCGACPATSDCSSANDTQCDAADTCSVPNSSCGEVYNGNDPERCVKGNEICNDSDAQHTFVLCYSTWECSCTYDQVDNDYTCDQEQGGQPDYRPNCQIVQQGSSFTLTNHSASVVRIEKIGRSCPCLHVALPTTRVVAPGASARSV